MSRIYSIKNMRFLAASMVLLLPALASACAGCN